MHHYASTAIPDLQNALLIMVLLTEALTLDGSDLNLMKCTSIHDIPHHPEAVDYAVVGGCCRLSYSAS